MPKATEIVIKRFVDDVTRLYSKHLVFRRAPLECRRSVSDPISEAPAPPGRYRDAATGGSCRSVPTAPLRTDASAAPCSAVSRLVETPGLPVRRNSPVGPLGPYGLPAEHPGSAAAASEASRGRLKPEVFREPPNGGADSGAHTCRPKFALSRGGRGRRLMFPQCFFTNARAATSSGRSVSAWLPSSTTLA